MYCLLFVGGNKREEDEKLQMQDDFNSSPGSNISAAAEEAETKGVINLSSSVWCVFINSYDLKYKKGISLTYTA